MSIVRSKKWECRAKAVYRLSKVRQAAVERARRPGQVDPLAAPEVSTKARRTKAGAP